MYFRFSSVSPIKADTVLDLIQKRLKKYFVQLGIISASLRHEQLSTQLNQPSTTQLPKDKQEKIAVTLTILQELQDAIAVSAATGTPGSDTRKVIDLIFYCIEQSIVAKNKQLSIMARLEPSEFSLALDDIIKNLAEHCILNGNHATIVHEKITSLETETSKERIQKIQREAKKERHDLRGKIEDTKNSYDPGSAVSSNSEPRCKAERLAIERSKKNEANAIKEIQKKQQILNAFSKAFPKAKTTTSSNFWQARPASSGKTDIATITPA